MGRWGDFENLRTAVSPRSVYSDEFNSTFNSTQESLEEVYEPEDKGQLIDLAEGTKKSRSSSSQSDASESSTDSIVRYNVFFIPLKTKLLGMFVCVWVILKKYLH